MEFKDVLNRYMERTGCSARDLAERSACPQLQLADIALETVCRKQIPGNWRI